MMRPASLFTLLVCAAFAVAQQPASERPPTAANSDQVEELKSRFQASEAAAKTTAAKLRQLTRAGDESTREQVAQLKEQLRREVTTSFALQQTLHELEATTLDARLVKTRELVAQRNQLKEQIVSQRMKGLLDPALLWDLPEAGNTTNSDQPTGASPDELAFYRDYLWKSLAPLFQERNKLLTYVSELEQQIASLGDAVEIPADASPETQQRLAEENRRHAAKIQQLRDRAASIQTEVDSAERQIALLKRKLAETPVSSDINIALDSVVLDLDESRVAISVGLDDGARRGMRLKVYRDERYLGDVEIIKVEREQSVARIIQQADQTPIDRGDRALRLLDTRIAKVIGNEPGEPIYNDRLRRFKFQFERIQVPNEWDIAEEFWLQYRGRGNPRIVGVWGDPLTNSLVVVGPPEADQAIRDTIAQWEGDQIGVEFRDDESLEVQQQYARIRHRSLLEQVTWTKLDLIDAEAKTPPDAEQLEKLRLKLQEENDELETQERKLEVIDESLQRLQHATPKANDSAATISHTFRDTIAGRWVIQSCEIDGRLFEPRDGEPIADDAERQPAASHRPRADEILKDYAVLLFTRDQASFGDADNAQQWQYSLEEETDPRRITFRHADGKRLQAIVWAWKRQLVLSIASADSTQGEGDRPASFKTKGTANICLRFTRDETDPTWLRQLSAETRGIATNLLVRGNANQQQTARDFLAMADSWEQEAELRQQAHDAAGRAASLRQLGKLQQAKTQDQEADTLRAHAEEVRAEREHNERVRNHDRRFRQQIKQLNDRAAALRRDGRFVDADTVDREIKELLRDQDPDLLRANELKHRAAQARLDGQHADAKLFDNQANVLLQTVRTRYEDADVDGSTDVERTPTTGPSAPVVR